MSNEPSRCLDFWEEYMLRYGWLGVGRWDLAKYLKKVGNKRTKKKKRCSSAPSTFKQGQQHRCVINGQFGDPCKTQSSGSWACQVRTTYYIRPSARLWRRATSNTYSYQRKTTTKKAATFNYESDNNSRTIITSQKPRKEARAVIYLDNLRAGTSMSNLTRLWTCVRKNLTYRRSLYSEVWKWKRLGIVPVSSPKMTPTELDLP